MNKGCKKGSKRMKRVSVSVLAHAILIVCVCVAPGWLSVVSEETHRCLLSAELLSFTFMFF